MGHGKSLGSLDGPPILLYGHGWATKQKPTSTFITYYDKYNSKQVKHNTNLTGLYIARWEAWATPPPLS
jgi:hypothetical protein